MAKLHKKLWTRLFFNSLPLLTLWMFWRLLMTFANSFDPDEIPHFVGPHLGSKLFVTQIIYRQRFWMETIFIFFQFYKRKNKQEKFTRLAKSYGIVDVNKSVYFDNFDNLLAYFVFFCPLAENKIPLFSPWNSYKIYHRAQYWNCWYKYTSVPYRHTWYTVPSVCINFADR